MPNVGGVEYPYTPQGIAAAQQAMSPPLTSPSHPMAQRQVPDLQPSNVGQWYSMGSPNRLTQGDPSFYGTQRSVPDLQPAHRNYNWRGEASRSPSSPHATAPTYEDRYAMQSDPSRLVGGAPIRGQHTYARSPSNPAAQRPTPDLQRYNDPPIQGRMEGNGILGTLGYSNEAMPSRQDLGNVVAYGDSGLRYGDNRMVFSQPQLLGGPSSPWYQPVAQAPRGQTIETSGSGNYGSSPSNPNWGQDVGGRSIQKMGPKAAPVSTNYSAISPSNRIAGNISAVMSGRQGPSPGTSPYLNESGRLSSPPNARPWTGFGPTGQPLPSRQPVQKNYPRG
jgi:hypothetical protein